MKRTGEAEGEPAGERPLVDALAVPRQLQLHHLYQHRTGLAGAGTVRRAAQPHQPMTVDRLSGGERADPENAPVDPFAVGDAVAVGDHGLSRICGTHVARAGLLARGVPDLSALRKRGAWGFARNCPARRPRTDSSGEPGFRPAIAPRVESAGCTEPVPRRACDRRRPCAGAVPGRRGLAWRLVPRLPLRFQAAVIGHQESANPYPTPDS